MIIHIVKQNDTIYSIANFYGTLPSLIIEINDLSDLPYLVIGQALLILIPDETHTVQRGETLESIANMHGTNVIKLLQKNPALINNNTLYEGQKIVISYKDEQNKKLDIYSFVYPYVSKSILRTSLPYVTRCAVFGYGIRPDGSLIEIDDQPIINLCYEYKTAPVMLLTSLSEDGNFDSGVASRMFNDITLQNRVIQNMLRIMKTKGYLGADIDFEYINSEDREAYIGFVRNVTNQMNQNGFKVNIDLAPKTSSTQPGTLYEGHDYAALGAAANTVLLMTYEWGYTYGPDLVTNAPLTYI